jgi:phosphoribosyl 1,2-cyclic phosphodiesterase
MLATFWGTRGSIPTPGLTTARYGGNTPCVEIAVDDRLLILDVGTGAHPLGLDLLRRADGRPIEAHLLISHTHWDHIHGLPFFMPLYEPAHRFTIHGPPGIDRTLEKLISGQMDFHYFPVEMTEVAATVTFHEAVEPVIDLGAVRIRTFYLHHTTVTLGFRIEAHGRSIVYATDHELHGRMYAARGRSPAMMDLAQRHDADFTAFVAGADLYIADTQYREQEYAAKAGWGHSTVEDITALAARAGVRQLALFHHDPLRTDEGVDELLGSARTIVAAEHGQTACVAAREGTSISVA